MQNLDEVIPDPINSEKCQPLNMRYGNVKNFPKFSKKFNVKLKKSGILIDPYETVHVLIKFLLPFIKRDIDNIIRSYFENYFNSALENIEANVGLVDENITQKITDLIYLNIFQLNKPNGEIKSFDDLTAACEATVAEKNPMTKPRETLDNQIKPKKKSIPQKLNFFNKIHSPLNSLTPFSPKSPYAKGYQTRLLISRQSSRYKRLAYLKSTLNNRRKTTQKERRNSSASNETMAFFSHKNTSYDFFEIPDLMEENSQNDSFTDIQPSLDLFSNNNSRACNSTANVDQIKLNGLKSLVKTTTYDLGENCQFVLGSEANIWLGLGSARGRIYSKYPNLFRYKCDKEDKDWLVKAGHLKNHRVRAYLMLLDEIKGTREDLMSNDKELDNSLMPTSFIIPGWLQNKIKGNCSSENNDRQNDTDFLVMSYSRKNEFSIESQISSPTELCGDQIADNSNGTMNFIEMNLTDRSLKDP